MKTNIYIDGFNLYYGALKGTTHKWLDINKLCVSMLPKNTIGEIKYFTARVSARPSDPGQPVRQQIFFRALSTLPNVSLHYGHFLSHSVRMPTVSPPPKYVDVIKTEEKGSDVNLATHLLHDAHMGKFDTAMVISNDSDLLEPIKIIRGVLGKKIGVLFPPHANISKVLRHNSDFSKVISNSHLSSSQFPSTMTDAVGTFTKPATW